MPKRATLTFTSEDAPVIESEQLRVYYCKYSGKAAFITDCKIERLPKRKTDHAVIMDTTKYMIKLYTTDGGVKLIRRRNGKVERQFRLNIDMLPVAYKSEENGRYLYIMDEAVAEFSSLNRIGATSVAPIPPCITSSGDGSCHITLEIKDKESRGKILKVTATAVHMSIIHSLSQDQAYSEITEIFGRILGCHTSQLSIKKGPTARNTLLSIQNIENKDVYDKLLSLESD